MAPDGKAATASPPSSGREGGSRDHHGRELRYADTVASHYPHHSPDLYGRGMDAGLVVLSLLGVVISYVILYYVIRAAVRSGMNLHDEDAAKIAGRAESDAARARNAATVAEAAAEAKRAKDKRLGL